MTAWELAADDLALFRETYGLTQAELADLLNVHERTVSNWEQARRQISPLLPLALWALKHGYAYTQRGIKLRKRRARKQKQPTQP